MKSSPLLICLILLSFLLSCAKNESSEFNKSKLTKIIQVATDFELCVPESFELKPLQGIDSYVAEIIDNNDDSFRIHIDIGWLAGYYVDEESQSKQERSSANSNYWFEAKDTGWLSGENCCLFYTFPELGPANFIARDNDQKDLVDAIIESLRVI